MPESILDVNFNGILLINVSPKREIKREKLSNHGGIKRNLRAGARFNALRSARFSRNLPFSDHVLRIPPTFYMCSSLLLEKLPNDWILFY